MACISSCNGRYISSCNGIFMLVIIMVYIYILGVIMVYVCSNSCERRRVVEVVVAFMESYECFMSIY